MSMQKRGDPKYARALDRGMLRSAFVSLFWGVISVRKSRDGFTLKALAKILGTNKAEVSRWFKGDPNWTINTIANLASALDLELRIEARERSTGRIFTPSGLVQTRVIQNPLRPVTETGRRHEAAGIHGPQTSNRGDRVLEEAA